MTPSGWGDAAQGRDAGHDEMQARVYRDWCKQIADGYVIQRKNSTGKVTDFVASGVDVESAITLDDRILGFVDIAVQFHEKDDDNGTYWFFLEIKPIIYSVGSVIRQCRATELNADRIINRDLVRGRQRKSWCDVFAVVYEDDPKALLLNELYPQTVRISREATP